MSNLTKPAQTQLFGNPAPTSREALKVELEATRSAFHAMLAEVSQEAWKLPTHTTNWTIGETICHVASYLDVVVPMALANARQGKNMPKMPKAIGNYFNYLMARHYTRKLSRQTIAAQYDSAHTKTLRLLEGVQAEEWAKSTYLPIGTLTVAQLFQHHSTHFHTHLADVRYGLHHQK
jgi:hypothetical protein